MSHVTKMCGSMTGGWHCNGNSGAYVQGRDGSWMVDNSIQLQRPVVESA